MSTVIGTIDYIDGDMHTPSVLKGKFFSVCTCWEVD
jgi:hypothetical protein